MQPPYIATETRAEWKREAVEKAAKEAKLQRLLKDSQPSAIASNLKLRKKKERNEG